MNSSKWYAWHVLKLRTEAHARFDRLMDVLEIGDKRGDDLLTLDGMRIRLAVDDFKNILSEIRKLK